jgi:hypothetical protein
VKHAPDLRWLAQQLVDGDEAEPRRLPALLSDEPVDGRS